MEYVNSHAAEKLADYQLPKELKEHLVKAHEWGDEFADQVLKEYWRYIQMLVVVKGMMIPSQVLAQVGEIHQRMDAQNWRALNILLVKPLNIDIDRQKDDKKYLEVYLKTLEDYKQIFHEFPPTEVWEDPIQEEIDKNNRLLMIIPVVGALILAVAFLNGVNMILASMAVFSFGILAYLYVGARKDQAKKMEKISAESDFGDMSSH